MTNLDPEARRFSRLVVITTAVSTLCAVAALVLFLSNVPWGVAIVTIAVAAQVVRFVATGRFKRRAQV